MDGHVIKYSWELASPNQCKLKQLFACPCRYREKKRLNHCNGLL